MADEGRFSAQLSVTKSNFTDSRNFSFNFDVAGTNFSAGVQNISISAHEALAVSGDVGLLGWALFRNLDATNYVEIGTDTTGTFRPFIRLKAGEGCAVRLSPSIVVYAKANTATVDLEYRLYET